MGLTCFHGFSKPSGKQLGGSHVETEVNDVAFLHDVVLAL